MNHDITGDACAGDGIGFAVRSKRRGAALAANRYRDGIVIARILIQGEGIIRGIGCRCRRRCVCRAVAGNRDGISLRSSVGANDQITGDIAHRKAAIVVLADANRLAAHGAAGKAVIIMRILLRSKGIIFAMAHSGRTVKSFGQGDGIVACHGDGGGRASAKTRNGIAARGHSILIRRSEGRRLYRVYLRLDRKGQGNNVPLWQGNPLRLFIHAAEVHISAFAVRFWPRNADIYAITAKARF